MLRSAAAGALLQYLAVHVTGWLTVQQARTWPAGFWLAGGRKAAAPHTAAAGCSLSTIPPASSSLQGLGLVISLYVAHSLATDLTGRPLDYTAPLGALFHKLTLIPVPGASAAGTAAAARGAATPAAKPARVSRRRSSAAVSSPEHEDPAAVEKENEAAAKEAAAVVAASGGAARRSTRRRAVAA